MSDKEDSNNSAGEIRTKLVNTEVKLLEQDHRIVPVIRTFLTGQRDWPKGEPRRLASFLALIHRLFFSPTMAITAGTIVGLVTLLFLYRQTQLKKFGAERGRSYSNP